MSDLEDLAPFIFGGVLIAAIVGLMWLQVRSERQALDTFHRQCLAIPKSEAECQLLLSLKRSADDAAFSASLAAGAAVGAAASAGAR